MRSRCGSAVFLLQRFTIDAVGCSHLAAGLLTPACLCLAAKESMQKVLNIMHCIWCHIDNSLKDCTPSVAQLMVQLVAQPPSNPPWPDPASAGCMQWMPSLSVTSSTASHLVQYLPHSIWRTHAKHVPVQASGLLCTTLDPVIRWLLSPTGLLLPHHRVVSCWAALPS